MASYISGIGTANPSNKFSQADLAKFMSNAHGTVNGSEAKLKALYRATGIKYRYSVLSDYGHESENYSFYPNSQNLEPFPDTAQRMDLYKKEALSLSVAAVENCLNSIQDLDKKRLPMLLR